jgi:oligopeptide transport system substrate-binding protein
VPPSRLPVHRKESPHLLRERPLLTVWFLNLNTARPPLNDVRVRRALALALRRGPMLERAMFGSGLPALTVVPSGLTGYPSPGPVTEDEAAARAALAAAGFPEGRGFPQLELLAAPDGSAALNPVLQETWRKVLGIEVSIAQTESRVMWSEMQAKNYTIGRGGWQGDYADATTFLDLWRRGGGWNFTNWANPRYDALLDAANAELDPAKRQQTLSAAEALLLEEMPVIPLYFDRRAELIDPAVRDWPDNIEFRHRFEGVWLQGR